MATSPSSMFLYLKIKQSPNRWKLIFYTAIGTVASTAVVVTVAYCVMTGDYTFMKLIGAATTEVAVTAIKAKVK